MNYQVKWTSQFRKDYKRLQRRGLDMNLLDHVIRLLARGEPLPPEYLNHGLSGNLAGMQECHVRPDWLLVYCYTHDILVLTLSRTGTHSDLFGK